MARVKRGVVASAKHKKVLKLAKGYQGARSRVYRVAKQAVIKAEQYAYRDRKKKKIFFRGLWIQRLNAAVRAHGMNYSTFINALKRANVNLDRKALSNMAIDDINAFERIVQIAKETIAESA